MTIFPKEGLQALPHSKGVLISTPTLGTEYEGFVLDLPGQPKTLYVDGKNSASVNLRERYVTQCSHLLGLVFHQRGTDHDGHVFHIYLDSLFTRFLLSRCSIVALLDLASENLDCEALVIVLERSAPNLGELLHSLMYVNGSVVTKPPFTVDPAFVLVGLDI